MNKQKLLLAFAFLFQAALLPAQVKFVNKTQLLSPAQHYSSIPVGVTDMNGDGSDDIIRLDQGLDVAIEYQTAPNQPFTHLAVDRITNDGEWGMCVADVDNNGYPDVLAGGAYDGIKIIMANANGTAFTVSELDEPGTFVQGINFADIDNDGWLDAFVCHDDEMSRTFQNDGAGQLELNPMMMNLATVPVSDNSGNYGSVWCDVDNDGDLDLYIAKCRQDVNDPTDGRRINQLFLNNGSGVYIQDITNVSGLRIGAQSWTADFGDIDNDGDFDCFITNHDVSSQLLENDGAGHFTDISVAAGIHNTIGGFPIQGVFRDFDNDGYVDILVAGNTQYLLRNNGNKTFSVVEDAFDDNEMGSFAIGDLNHDGFQDVYAVYQFNLVEPGDIEDVLWMNAGNDNHYFGLNLRGVQSNRNAVGAKVILYSALGTQVREVRSGESYGIMNSMQIHFGMGQLTKVDSVKIYWPAGTVDVLGEQQVDQYISVEEGGCIVPQVLVEADGPTTFCGGQTVNLNVGGDFTTYTWNNGATTSGIQVGVSGNYWATVTDANGCSAVSIAVSVTVDPVEIPQISISGDSVICQGSTVVLTSSPSTAYTWSTGDTTGSIAVTASGSYTVTTQGLCAQFTSAPIQITVLDNPEPVVTADTIAPNQSATLAAAGDAVNWYSVPAGGNPFFTGNEYATPPLGSNTTYWVSNTKIYDQPNQFTGMTDHQGTNFGDPQINGQIIFECIQPFRLKRVKVYANTAGERQIDLRDDDNFVLQSKTVNIQAGTTILNLDFDVPVGKKLVLTTDEFVNFNNLGSIGPQLRRSSQGIAYPYVIPGVLSIYNSNYGADRYFYFFNWEVDFYEYTCVSDRVPVTAVVDPTLDAGDLPGWATGMRLFPNPVSGTLTVEMTGYSGGDLQVSVRTAQGAAVQTRQLAAAPGEVVVQQDLSGLPKGMYWLELSNGTGIARRKVVVQ